MKFYLVPENADFFSESFEGRTFDTREAANEFAQSVYLGADVNGQTSSWEIKQVPDEIDQWADRYERAAFIADVE